MQLVADAKHQSWNRSILFRLVTAMAPPAPSRLHRYSVVIGRAVLTAGLAWFAAKYGGRFLVDNFLRPSYIASTKIEVQPAAVAPNADAVIALPADLTILKSPSFLLPIIEDLGLKKAWATRVLGRADDQPLTSEEALDYLNRHLAIKRQKPDFLTIMVGSDLPDEAAQIANAVADRYKTLRDVEDEQQKLRTTDILTGQVAQQQKLVDEKKAALVKIREEDAGAGATSPTARLERLRPQLLLASEDYEQRRVLGDHIAKLPDDKIVSSFATTTGPLVNAPALIIERNKDMDEADSLRKSGTPESDPKIKAIESHIQMRNEQIASAAAGVRRMMASDFVASKKHLDELQREVNALAAQLPKEPSAAESALQVAQKDLDDQQALLDSIHSRQHQIGMDPALSRSPVRIVSRAEPPVHPTHHTAHMMTDLIAIFFAITAASFVEMVMLFRRAGDRDGS